MLKRQATVQWQVLLADEDWNRGEAPGPAGASGSIALRRERRGGLLAVPTSARRQLWWMLGIALLMILLCAVQGGRQAEAGLTRIETEIEAALALETTMEGGGRTVALQRVDLRADRAMAEVVVTEAALPMSYQELRFYRQTEVGWLPSGPDPIFWGRQRVLESEQFRFLYRERDAAAVAAAAATLDRFYNRMQRDLGLIKLMGDEKFTIDVTVSDPPDTVRPRSFTSKQLAVPSPALLKRPPGLAEEEALVQAVLSPLIQSILTERSEQAPLAWRWEPLHGGLRLWMLWESGTPLAAWQADLVHWWYVGDPELPGGYERFCQLYQVWGLRPIVHSLPIGCIAADASLAVKNRRLGFDQLAVPVALWPESTRPSIRAYGQSIALATLIEYVVQSYGRDRLPLLLDAFGEHDTWETLVPAFFGVSVAEFEAGWQRYLGERYGLSGGRSG